MSDGRIGPGRLVAVVGPSGSGKDSILRAAAVALAETPDIVFPRRVITRPPDLHEDHVPVTREEFAAHRANGAFAMDWEAHGMCYGVPAAVDDLIRDGATVAVNVSRMIIPQLRIRYSRLTVAAITVSAERLAHRLAQRGRETAAEIEQRVARAIADRPEGEDVIRIGNDGALDDAVAHFLAVLTPRERTRPDAAAAN